MQYRRKTRQISGGQAVRRILQALFGLLFLFSAWKLADSFFAHQKARSAYGRIESVAVSRMQETKQGQELEQALSEGYLSVDHAVLQEMNADYIGWLEIPNTQVSYPVVCARDYEEYLRTDFSGNDSLAGTLFIDYACPCDWSGRNTVIYGHRMNDGSMFGALKQYFDESFAAQHEEIRLYAPDGIRIYRVFSVYTAQAGDDSYEVDFSGDEAFARWFEAVAARSALAQRALQADAGSRVLLLSTCRGGDNEQRTVVAAYLAQVLRTDSGGAS